MPRVVALDVLHPRGRRAIPVAHHRVAARLRPLGAFRDHLIEHHAPELPVDPDFAHVERHAVRRIDADLRRPEDRRLPGRRRRAGRRREDLDVGVENRSAAQEVVVLAGPRAVGARAFGETAQRGAQLERRALRDAVYVGEAAGGGARERPHAPHERRRIEDLHRAPAGCGNQEARGPAVAQQDRENPDVAPQLPQVAGRPGGDLVERRIRLAGLVRIDRLEPALEAIDSFSSDVDGGSEGLNLAGAPPLGGDGRNREADDDRRADRALHPAAHASTAPIVRRRGKKGRP